MHHARPVLHLFIAATVLLRLTLSAGAAPQHAAPPDTVSVEPAAGTAPLLAFIAHARHTLVRITLEQHPYGTGTAAPALVFRTLAAHGVQVRWSSPTFTYTHAKYLVADDQSAWIGTMNWTTSAFRSNREFGVLDTDPTVVHQAEGVFSADWAHVPYRGPAGALVLSPVNARATLAALITHARHTLEVYAEEVQDQELVADLAAAARRGVRVRVVAAGAAAAGVLRAAGVAVVIRQSPYIHAKAIVADTGAVFIGSEDLSATSLDHNRELGLVLHDEEAIATVERAFDADFGGATVPVSPAPSPLPAGAFAVRVTVQPDPTSDGTPTTVTALTHPSAACTERVVYASGYAAVSRSLRRVETAGMGGTVRWTWTPDTSRPGEATANVSCTLDGRAAQGVARFDVR
jgi:hypothetical protein